MKKRIIAHTLILSIVMMLFAGITAFAAATEIVVSDAKCNAGEEITVDINMPANTGVVSVRLSVTFDASLELTEVVDGGILGKYNHSNKLESPYTLSWENDTARENLTTTGKLATLKFKVKEDAFTNDYPITIASAELLDFDINDVECKITNGKVSVNGVAQPEPDNGNWEEDTSEDKWYDDEPSGSGSSGSGSRPPKDEPKPEVKPDLPKEPEVTVKPAITYTDVAEKDWYHSYVTALSEKGIVSGNGNGTFAPQNNVTREQFLKMLLLATGVELKAGANPFGDVDENAWYKEYVLTAKEMGIVNGVSATEFGIGTNISRQDMAVMISRATEKLGIQLSADTVEAFADSDKVSAYAKDAVSFMKSIGLIQGYNNEFRPLDNLTRAEAAKVICSLMELM